MNKLQQFLDILTTKSRENKKKAKTKLKSIRSSLGGNNLHITWHVRSHCVFTSTSHILTEPFPLDSPSPLLSTGTRTAIRCPLRAKQLAAHLHRPPRATDPCKLAAQSPAPHNKPRSKTDPTDQAE